MNVDPLAEKYLSWSPYIYVMNNPLKHTDPTGMMLEPPTQPGKLEGETHYDEDTGASYEWNGEGGWHSDLQEGEELNEVVVTNEESSDREGSSGEEAGKPSSGVFNAAVGGLGFSTSVKNELLGYAFKNGELSAGTMKYLKYSKGLGTVANVVGVGNAGIKYYNEPSAGNATRLVVQGTAIGTAFIPGVGWVISLGISTADMIWGDQFYNWIDD